MDAGTLSGGEKTREGIDWPRLEALVAGQESDWYHELAGHDAYGKLKDLRARHIKHIVICPRSKRWWDEELMRQRKVVRRARRGGARKRLAGGRGRRESDMWKVEAAKIDRKSVV